MKTRNIIIAIALLSSCSGNTSHEAGGEDTTAVAAKDVMDLDDVTSKESLNAKYKDVLTRVKHIYSVVLSNTQYKDNFLSKEVNAIFEEGDKLSNGDIWGPDCNFWLYAQDFGNNAHLIEATINEVKNDTTVILECHIDIDLGTNESERFDTLYITMIKEDGEWYGDDSSNDKKWSYKKCCLDDIKYMKEQAKKQE